MRINFNNFFDINVRYNIDDIVFPTFEEVLGILDLAEIRKETFKYYYSGDRPAHTHSIPVLRRYLVELMAEALHIRLKNSKGFHLTLIKNLIEKDLINDTFFITTNYDILIDNALINNYPKIKIDYGIDFVNTEKLNKKVRPDKTGCKLYKIHGSLNWLYCSTCTNLFLTPEEKGVITYTQSCSECSTSRQQIVVPPTYFKDISNVFLSLIWNKTENSLRNIENIIFCGYSFPDADIHIKYLLKRIEINSQRKIKITIINQHDGKSSELALQEKLRYKRFFINNIDYTDNSFEDFAGNPSKFW